MFEAPLASSCWELSRLALVATPFRLHRFGLRSGMPSLEACRLLEALRKGQTVISNIRLVCHVRRVWVGISACMCLLQDVSYTYTSFCSASGTSYFFDFRIMWACVCSGNFQTVLWREHSTICLQNLANMPTCASPVPGKHHLDTESGLRYEDHMYEFVFSCSGIIQVVGNLDMMQSNAIAGVKKSRGTG